MCDGQSLQNAANFADLNWDPPLVARRFGTPTSDIHRLINLVMSDAEAVLLHRPTIGHPESLSVNTKYS